MDILCLTQSGVMQLGPEKARVNRDTKEILIKIKKIKQYWFLLANVGSHTLKYT